MLDRRQVPIVLYAEDEILIAETMAELLGEIGFGIHRTEDGLEALEVAQLHEFDVLLTDLDMPRMNGIELIRRLRSDSPGLPVVIITGNPPDGGVLGLGDLGPGPTLLLAKPMRIEEISAALRRVATLAKSASRSEGKDLPFGDDMASLAFPA